MPSPVLGNGRPKGALNRTTIEVREAARAIVDDPDYREALKIRLILGQASHMETLLWHYAYGKPKETVEIQADITVEKVVREIIRSPASEPRVLEGEFQPFEKSA